jgi:hypothetical protein
MPSKRSLKSVLAAVVLAALPSSAAAHTPSYPDLGMAPLSDIHLALPAGGQKQLRFSATIVNVGAAPFDLTASRPDTSTAFSVWQRVYNSDAGSQLVPTPDVSLSFGGDGHNHWHVQGLEHYELRRLDNGVKVGTSMKSGFCFFDTGPFRLSLPGAPGSRVYTGAGCGGASSLGVTMGLSVGWGDTYGWTLPDQFIDVTDLSSGKYRLYAEADPTGWFSELSKQNNSTWVDLSLTINRKGGSKVRILGYGPSA